MTFACNRFRACTDQNVHARLGIGVARLADADNAPVFDADVGFDNAPMVEDQRVGNHHIDDFGIVALALPHAVADDFAATEFDFIAVHGVVVFDFDNEGGIAQTHAVARGCAVHFGIGLSADFHANAPMILPWKP